MWEDVFFSWVSQFAGSCAVLHGLARLAPVFSYAAHFRATLQYCTVLDCRVAPLPDPAFCSPYAPSSHQFLRDPPARCWSRLDQRCTSSATVAVVVVVLVGFLRLSCPLS